MTQAVIFDLDGVIVDTALFHYQGWKMLADELGIAFDEKSNEKLRGIPRRESLLAMLGYNPGEDKIKAYCDKKNDYYLEKVKALKLSDTLPGAKELIEQLKKAGFKTAMASSSKNARLVLDLIGMTGEFDAIVDGNEIEKGKPDPELFLKAAGLLGIEPADCLVIEDAESGVAAALAAGMTAIGVGNQEALGQADLVVDSLEKVDVATIEKFLSQSFQD